MKEASEKPQTGSSSSSSATTTKQYQSKLLINTPRQRPHWSPHWIYGVYCASYGDYMSFLVLAVCTGYHGAFFPIFFIILLLLFSFPMLLFNTAFHQCSQVGLFKTYRKIAPVWQGFGLVYMGFMWLQVIAMSRVMALSTHYIALTTLTSNWAKCSTSVEKFETSNDFNSRTGNKCYTAEDYHHTKGNLNHSCFDYYCFGKCQGICWGKTGGFRNDPDAGIVTLANVLSKCMEVEKYMKFNSTEVVLPDMEKVPKFYASPVRHPECSFMLKFSVHDMGNCSKYYNQFIKTGPKKTDQFHLTFFEVITAYTENRERIKFNTEKEFLDFCNERQTRAPADSEAESKRSSEQRYLRNDFFYVDFRHRLKPQNLLDVQSRVHWVQRSLYHYNMYFTHVLARANAIPDLNKRNATRTMYKKRFEKILHIGPIFFICIKGKGPNIDVDYDCARRVFVSDEYTAFDDYRLEAFGRYEYTGLDPYKFSPFFVFCLAPFFILAFIIVALGIRWVEVTATFLTGLMLVITMLVFFSLVTNPAFTIGVSYFWRLDYGQLTTGQFWGHLLFACICTSNNLKTPALGSFNLPTADFYKISFVAVFYRIGVAILGTVNVGSLFGWVIHRIGLQDDHFTDKWLTASFVLDFQVEVAIHFDWGIIICCFQLLFLAMGVFVQTVLVSFTVLQSIMDWLPPNFKSHVTFWWLICMSWFLINFALSVALSSIDVFRLFDFYGISKPMAITLVPLLIVSTCVLLMGPYGYERWMRDITSLVFNVERTNSQSKFSRKESSRTAKPSMKTGSGGISRKNEGSSKKGISKKQKQTDGNNEDMEDTQDETANTQNDSWNPLAKESMKTTEKIGGGGSDSDFIDFEETILAQLVWWGLLTPMLCILAVVLMLSYRTIENYLLDLRWMLINGGLAIIFATVIILITSLIAALITHRGPFQRRRLFPNPLNSRSVRQSGSKYMKNEELEKENGKKTEITLKDPEKTMKDEKEPEVDDTPTDRDDSTFRPSEDIELEGNKKDLASAYTKKSPVNIIPFDTN